LSINVNPLKYVGEITYVEEGNNNLAEWMKLRYIID